jgi:prepilin peptidase CpaA
MDFPLLFSLILLGLMVLVVVMDVRYYIIPNVVNAALLLLYIPAAWLLELDWQMALLAAGLTLLVGMGVFTLGLMGGGDVKLLVAAMLWTGWSATSAQFLIGTAFLGGVLVILVGLLRAIAYAVRSPTEERPLPRILTRKQPVPYGVAIACAFAVLVAVGRIQGLPALV